MPAALLLAVFTTALGSTAVVPLLPELVAQGPAHARAAHISGLAAAGPLGMMLAAPLWGLASDRLPRLPLLLAGLAGFALSLALMGWPDLTWLYTSRFLNGAFAGAVTPLAFAIMADRSPSAPARARAFTSLNALAYAGYLVGPLFGDWVTTSLASPFYASAGAAVVSLVALATFRWRDNPTRACLQEISAPHQATRRAPLLIVSAVAAGSLGALHVALTLRTETEDLTRTDTAGLLSLCSVVMLLAQLALIRVRGLAARARRLVGPVLFALAAALAASAGARTPWALAAVLTVMAWSSATASLLMSYLISLGPRGRRGFDLGAQAAVAAAGQAAAGLLAAWATARNTGPAVWFAAAGAVLLSALLFEVAGRGRGKARARGA